MQSAYRFHLSEHVIHHYNIPIPTPSSDEVILQVFGSGLCHSDVHCRDGSLRLVHDNFIGGHEISGKVWKVGENISKDYLGKRMAVLSNNPCHKCYACSIGSTNVCVNSIRLGYGLGIDGGWQQYMRIVKPESCLVEIPENVPYGVAAVVTDSVLTPYHAIKKMKLDSSQKVLIVGAGGLGTNAIQIVKTYNCDIVVVDVKEELRESALKAGAGKFFTSLQGYHSDYFDAVVDVVGLDSTYGLALKYIKPCGKLAAIGLGKGKLNVNLPKVCNKEITIFGNYYGTKFELKECLDLVSRGLITPVIIELPFHDINTVVNDLRDGKIKGRAVFTPNAQSKL